MADFEPPSFSLGLDLLAEDQHQDATVTRRVEARELSFDLLLEGEGEEDEDSQPPVLKRLKRGPPSSTRPQSATNDPVLEVLSDLDDEIDEFSSPEDRRKAKTHSTCSSSKLSLRSQSVLTSQLTDGSTVKSNLTGSSASARSKYAASTTKQMVPSAFNSPLRKIQLLDSDSDEPSASEDICEIDHKTDASRRKPTAFQSDIGVQKKLGVRSSPLETLWKDSNESHNTALATPALDEFCQEYFNSMKCKGVARGKEGDVAAVQSTGSCFSNQFEGLIMDCHKKTKVHDKVKRLGGLGDGILHAYRYFYHDDLRIQKLVAERLSNFCPLGYENHGTNNWAGERVIDYMNQFGQKEAPAKANQISRSSNNRSEERRGKSAKNRNPATTSEGSRATTGWVDPKSTVTVPKDAGKRRIQAEGGSAGHWYTGQGGRKVYVSKTGEELNGQAAYRRYRKESGRGFKRRKKTATRKKSK